MPDIDPTTDDPTTDDDQPEPETFDRKYVAKLREEAKTYRLKAMEGEAALKKLAEIEEAGKPEAQKTAEELARLQTENAALQKRLLRQAIAAKHGVPERRLVGDTEEELEADAAELAAELKVKAGPPKADDMGEKTPIGGDGQLKADAVKSMKPEDVLKALKEGRFNDVLKGA
jgi:hypothetical protein